MEHSAKSNLENFDIYMKYPNIDCYVSMAELLRPKKKIKKEHRLLLPWVIYIPREIALK